MSHVGGKAALSTRQVQVDSFDGLAGRTVLGWKVLELALDGPPPVWSTPEVPFLQCQWLQADCAEGPVVFQTAPAAADDDWGVAMFAIGLARDDIGNGEVFRQRSAAELPVGAVEDVVIAVNPDSVRSVNFRIAGRRVRITAAAIHRREDGAWGVQHGEESLVVQVDGRRPGEDAPRG